MKIAAFLIVITMFTATLSAEIYKWTDSDGGIHFSDKPISDSAETVKVFDSDGGTVKVERDIDAPARRTKDLQSKEKPKTYITSSDYKISRAATLKNGVVAISGRIEGGPECRSLTVNCFATSKAGYRASCSTAVSVGKYGSSLYECIDPYADKDGPWSATGIYVNCQD